MAQRIRIGEVGIDSGQLLVCDPCYVPDEAALRYENVQAAREHAGFQKPFLQLKFNKGHNGAGVVFDSGLGDGMYAVYAVIEDVPGWGERLVKVEIEFLGTNREAVLSRMRGGPGLVIDAAVPIAHGGSPPIREPPA